MNEIECVRQNSTQDEYLKKLFLRAHLPTRFLSWEDSKISTNSPLVLVVDEDSIEALTEICEFRDLKVIIALNTRKEFKLVSKLTNQFEKIFGFIDLSQELDYNTPILLNYINLNFSSHAVKLDKLANDLDKIYEYTKSELIKVKDLHDRLVKVRVDSLKGITVTSKFMAGEKSGGEFFDMIQTGNEFLFLLAGSDNYIVSSLILSEIEVLKLSAPTTSLKNQTEQFLKMIIKHATDNKANLNYCMVSINLSNLRAECQFKGEGYLYFQNQLMDFSQPISMTIKPSEKFYLLSGGAIKNLTLLNPDLSVENFYKENSDKNTKDLINEFFFEVSRNKAGSFLIHDALMNVIEVDQKKIYQL